MTQYQRWLERVRALPATAPEPAEASLSRIMLALDRRAALRARVHRLGGGILALAACGLVAHQLGPIARHATPQRTVPALPAATPAPEAAESTPHHPAASAPATESSADATPSERARPRSQPRAPRASAREPAAWQRPADGDGDQAFSTDASARTTDADALRGLFEVAHRLQFTGAPGAALRAWDQYLTVDASGPLSIEARYYRALTLIRLGRTGEAREALQAFARGQYGEFRKHDAARWLKQLQP